MTDDVSQDWIDDCLKYWGRVLTGKHAHWCADWDFLPIDETTEVEFSGCSCIDDEDLAERNTLVGVHAEAQKKEARDRG